MIEQAVLRPRRADTMDGSRSRTRRGGYSGSKPGATMKPPVHRPSAVSGKPAGGQSSGGALHLERERDRMAMREELIDEFRMLVPWELQTRIHAERFAKIAMKVFEKYA